MIDLTVHIGADPRQPLAYTVCASSILRHSRSRIAVEPIGLYPWIEGFSRRGLTSFTFARYLCPSVRNYYGYSIFLDGDIIVRSDIHDLLDVIDLEAPVSVAKHVARFEWPSVMVFNNAKCKVLTKEWVDNPRSNPQKLEWAEKVGELPKEWNHCVGYEPHREDAKLIHYTAGLPCWPETESCPHAEKWKEELSYAIGTVSWKELMGGSVHTEIVKKWSG